MLRSPRPGPETLRGSQPRTALTLHSLAIIVLDKKVIPARFCDMDSDSKFVTELVYDTVEVENLCRAKWPDCKIEDASDYIHESRFEIKVTATPVIFIGLLTSMIFFWLVWGSVLRLTPLGISDQKLSMLFMMSLCKCGR